jgi:cytoskeletal protein RodZ
MNDIGSQLRQAREAQDLSLEIVQKATRIKRTFLEAIEADRFEDLPGPVQVRGFVRSYASYLGLDPDQLLLKLGDAPRQSAAAPSRSSDDARIPAPGRQPFARSESALPLPLPVLIIGVVILLVVGGLLLVRAFTGEAPPPTPAQPVSLPLSMSRTPEPAPAQAAPGRVTLTLTSSEHVWVRVTHDGITAFEGILDPDQPQTWQAELQVIVETGNGAALNAAVNGANVGVLGPRNRVVVRAWGVEGEVTPAPTAVPAPPEASATPEA